MLKKLLVGGLSGVGLLVVGCGNAETKTFVANAIILPENSDEASDLGKDQDGDGDVDDDDNSLGVAFGALAAAGVDIDLNGTLATAVADGTVLIGLDVTAKDFANDDAAEATGYLAEIVGGGIPAFDGTDQIAPVDQEFAFNDVSIVNGVIATGGSDFQLVLPIDPANPTVLTLNNTVLDGTINADGTLSNGILTGVIEAVELAKNLNGVGTLIDGLIQTAASVFNAGGAPVACGDDATCEAVGANGVCTDTNADAEATGVCVDSVVDSGVILLLSITDVNGNGNGTVEITFNEANGNFDVNEAAAIFDIDGGVAGGLLGLALFQLEGGTKAGVGVGFAAAAATR